MTGHRPFSDLTRDWSPARRQRVKDGTDQLLQEMRLHELRRARELTQLELARKLNLNQPAVAKLEQRADVYVSSLRHYIEAVGGQLKVIAEFPEGDVTITNFSEVGNSPTPRP